MNVKPTTKTECAEKCQQWAENKVARNKRISEKAKARRASKKISVNNVSIPTKTKKRSGNVNSVPKKPRITKIQKEKMISVINKLKAFGLAKKAQEEEKKLQSEIVREAVVQNLSAAEAKKSDENLPEPAVLPKNDAPNPNGMAEVLGEAVGNGAMAYLT